MKNFDSCSFPTEFNEIIKQLDHFTPYEYSSSRNYLDGSVSYLSPYISRGVISTKFVLDYLTKKGYNLRKIEKYIQELAWRDYWQEIWIHKNIDIDLKHTQPDFLHYEVPSNIINASTNIQSINNGIHHLVENGYIHNHIRMYIAMLTCNIGKAHWLLPAKWMYYHLLDHDWGSNALSWQWVAGANSNKKYYANQANINKYTHSYQIGTYLDTTYENLEELQLPIDLKDTSQLNLSTKLPISSEINIDTTIPTYIYNSYNLDPLWNQYLDGNRILLLEPSHFENYPVSEKVINFILNLSQNIQGIQLFVGEFETLQKQLGVSAIYYKEHPTVIHYKGNKEERDWIANVKGYYPSFFKYWKFVKKEIFNNTYHEPI